MAYRQETGRYWGRVRAVAGGAPLERLTPQQVSELRLLFECAVRGKVAMRSLESWLVQLADRDDRPPAAAALRARVEKANDVELLGRGEAA